MRKDPFSNTVVPQGRSTRPPGFNPNPGGGISIIPRRGWTAHDAASDAPFGRREDLLAFAARNPWLLSEALADADPTMGKAQSNALAACAAPGTVKLTAYNNIAAGDGEDTPNKEATGEVADLLNRLGPEVGGIDGLRTKGTMAILHYGLWCFECILGPRLTGLTGIGFVDPLSIEFDRNEKGYLRVYQKQPGKNNGRQELNQNTFLWHAHHASVSNPYGRAIFCAGVVETLRAIAFDQDLSDGTHNIAFARYKYKYSLETFWRIAMSPREKGGLELPIQDTDENGNTTYPAKQFVDAQMANIDAYLQNRNPDDNYALDASGDVDVLPAGSFVGMEPVINHKDFRQIRALDELATTIGRPNSGAQTYTTAEFGLKALGWEALRADVMAPILKMLDLHFASSGRDIVVRAEFEPIRRSDEVQEANADSVRDEVAWNRYLRGAITFEDYCMQSNGKGSPENEDDSQKAAREKARQEENSSAAVPAADVSASGTTQEEQQANQQ